MMDLKIRGEFITLGQLLKLLDAVPSGGNVKAFLGSETILVNGEPENRRGKKLRPGDKIKVGANEEIVCT